MCGGSAARSAEVPACVIRSHRQYRVNTNVMKSEDERLSAAGEEVIAQAVLWYEWQSVASGDISAHIQRDLVRAVERYIRVKEGDVS